jgi:glutamate racemase
MQIGIFDSGVGGLTVLKEMAQSFASEDFYYLGDTARLPYGTKSPETIRQYAEQIMDFLAARKVDAIVIACNTASSQVPETLWKNIPVFNVIEPGAEAAVKATRSKRLGVLATRATVRSNSYTDKIHSFDKDIQVFAKSAPLLVGLAEEGWVDDPITDAVVARYLEPLLKNDIDTLILGCTHYPLLVSAIRKACGDKIRLIDSGSAICGKLAEKMSLKASEPTYINEIHFHATDLTAHTRILAQQILKPLVITEFDIVHL